MQLTEIKNDLATINYSPEINRLVLSDFILIEDSNQSILAQVISIEATMEDDVNSAMLKFLLSIDKDANLTQYTGYVPAKGATLILINPQEVVQLIKGSEKTLTFGHLAAYNDVPVELSIDFFRKRPYIQVDFVENKLQLVENIVKGLEKHNKKTLLFDFLGLYSSISLPTVTIGYNFKLPLNYEALCYIAQEELNDCDNENKATIQGILIEVQNYVKSTEDEFIPFDTLISVLDAQYEESPMPELLLLKNKLLKYQQQGLFAQDKSEFDFLDTFLKDAKNFKFDLSELPVSWHKIAFASILHLIKAKCYLISDFTDDNSSKSIIKKLYEKSEIKPIVISSYDYKYQLQLKALSKNLILFKPIQKINDFAGYTSFLNILSHDNFIVWGEQTLFIPLILKLQSYIKNDIKIPGNIKPKQKVDKKVVEESNEVDIDDLSAIDEVETVDDLSELSEENQPEPQAEDIEVVQDIEESEFNADFTDFDDFSEVSEEDLNKQQTQNVSSAQEVIDESDIPESLMEEDTQNDVEPQQEEFDFVETTQSEVAVEDEPSSEDLEFFFDENDMADENPSEDASKEVVSGGESSQDDTVYDLENVNYEENLSEPIVEQPAPPVADVSVQEEEPASDVKEIPQTEPELNNPTVPVYTSNVAPQLDTKFAQGTYVHHPKYGRGVVEKVINYGNKNLCSIIFDNVGRRLLDPNLAELKQV